MRHLASMSWFIFPWCHIYTSVNWVIIGLDNGLWPGLWPAIIWTNAGISSIWTLRNKLQWNFNWYSWFFIQRCVYENVVCEMVAVLSREKWVEIIRCYQHNNGHCPILMKMISFIRPLPHRFYDPNGPLNPGDVPALLQSVGHAVPRGQ